MKTHRALILNIAFLFCSIQLFGQGPSSQISDGQGQMDIIHLDVGQGDATLILGPVKDDGSRTSILVDSGEYPGRTKDGGKIVSDVLADLGITSLDYYVNSHHHADHYGGVLAGRYGHSFVLGPNNVPGAIGDDDGDGNTDYVGTGRRKKMDFDELGKGDDVNVKNWIDRGPKTSGNPSGMYKSYLQFAQNMGNHVEVVSLNDVNNTKYDLGGGAMLECVASNGWVKGKATRVRNVNTENEKSLAVLIHFGDFHYFVGGDINGQNYASENAYIEKEIGKYVESQGYTLDVIQVNHHGAANCTEKTFLDLTKPEAAIISCGDNNDHGHPHPDVIQRLVDANVKIYQTEKGKQKRRNPMPANLIQYQNIANGHIYLVTDGSTFNIKY